ncbi:MAG: hypothetical protein JNM18_17505 [Planctomycetaceae bacterium]|nr:hypothetical protein [Planctomycetaceae bacterium]
MFRNWTRKCLWALPILACLTWLTPTVDARPRFGYYGGYSYRPYTYYSPYSTYYRPYGTYYSNPYNYNYGYSSYYYPNGTYYSPYYVTPRSSFYYSW